MTTNLRKRFVKDYNLPITVFDNPYFEYYINLYEHLNAKTKYDRFTNLVSKLGGEGPFFNESKRIIDEMISAIKADCKYQDFISSEKILGFGQSINFPSKEVFKPENHDKYFISLDLQKANFQALKTFGLLSDYEDYKDFINAFTNESYFIDSKQIRQVVFGHLNPKRQQAIQRFIMGKISDSLINYNLIAGTSDELIFSISTYEELIKAEFEIKSFLNANFKWKFHVKGFRLVQIENKPFYKREYIDGTFDLKGIPAHYYAEVFKKVMKMEVLPNDKITMYDGRLVSFMDSLF